MSAVVAAARPIGVLALWSIRESFRRRVFLVVALLTLGFLALFFLGCHVAFDSVRDVDPSSRNPGDLDARELAGATLHGLAMFATLFLGCVLAAFLTLSAVRGDAENGLLQPLVVRPVGRGQVIAARWLAAAGVCTAYVAIVDLFVLATLELTGSWAPDRLLAAEAEVAAAVAVFAALCLLGSCVLTSVANGIASFMVLGAGMFAGLLGQVAHAIGNTSLHHVATFVSWLLPFEALYQDGLSRTTADHASGLTHALLTLGPFGGASPASGWLLLYAVGYVAGVGAIAIYAAGRRDL